MGGTQSPGDDGDGTKYFPPATSRLGARSGQRVSGATGLPTTSTRRSSDAALLACVSQVADKFAAMSDAYIGRSFGRTEEVIRDEVKKVVGESMQEIKDLLRSRDN